MDQLFICKISSKTKKIRNDKSHGREAYQCNLTMIQMLTKVKKNSTIQHLFLSHFILLFDGQHQSVGCFLKCRPVQVPYGPLLPYRVGRSGEGSFLEPCIMAYLFNWLVGFKLKLRRPNQSAQRFQIKMTFISIDNLKI